MRRANVGWPLVRAGDIKKKRASGSITDGVGLHCVAAPLGSVTHAAMRAFGESCRVAKTAVGELLLLRRMQPVMAASQKKEVREKKKKKKKQVGASSYLTNSKNFNCWSIEIVTAKRAFFSFAFVKFRMKTHSRLIGSNFILGCSLKPASQ